MTQQSGRNPSEMVRRVAEAICKAAGEKPDRVWQSEDDQASALGWEFYVTEAEAAIQAMRDPTLAMRKVSTFKAAEVEWPNMIDAALSDSTGADQTEGGRG